MSEVKQAMDQAVASVRKMLSESDEKTQKAISEQVAVIEKEKKAIDEKVEALNKTIAEKDGTLKDIQAEVLELKAKGGRMKEAQDKKISLKAHLENVIIENRKNF